MSRQDTERFNMEFYNSSLEPSFSRQFDGKFYHFSPRSKTVFPDHLDWQLFFETQNLKQYGVFPVLANMTKEQLVEAEYKALNEYLNGALRERIRNYQAEADDAKRKGITLEKDIRFERALRLQKELVHKLKVEAPRDDEWSFFDAETRQKLGIDDNQIKYFEGQNLFDPEVIKAENDLPSKVSKKKKIESFEEVNIGELGA